MTGFKNFILRGNLVELAVAFVMAGAFGAVVLSMVTMLMDILGKVGGSPNFSDYQPGGVHVGAFLTAVIAFVILAAVVYFLIVKPYTLAKERLFPAEPAGEPADISLLTEIRDLLAKDTGAAPGAGTQQL